MDTDPMAFVKSVLSKNFRKLELNWEKDVSSVDCAPVLLSVRHRNLRPSVRPNLRKGSTMTMKVPVPMTLLATI
uniref:Uncharacterized protein n=1 Tax=Steinernema glaseri TaxID=37863 RepID=A0A1I8AHK1_9BILA